MNTLRSKLGQLVLVMAIPLALAGCGYNTLPTQDEAVKTAWGQVQNEYQRRSDLIPNLVNTVKGYAKQEQSVLVEVTQARASATQVKVDASTITDPVKFQQFQDSQDKLSGVLGRLMMIQENYPDLKSNTNFLALQSQLEGTENRIAIARKDYNAAAQTYNTSLHTFPTLIWAKTAQSSYKPAQYFTASGAAQAAPVVSFDLGPAPPGSVAGAAPGSTPPPAK